MRIALSLVTHLNCIIVADRVARDVADELDSPDMDYSWGSAVADKAAAGKRLRQLRRSCSPLYWRTLGPRLRLRPEKYASDTLETNRIPQLDRRGPNRYLLLHLRLHRFGLFHLADVSVILDPLRRIIGLRLGVSSGRYVSDADARYASSVRRYDCCRIREKRFRTSVLFESSKMDNNHIEDAETAAVLQLRLCWPSAAARFYQLPDPYPSTWS